MDTRKQTPKNSKQQFNISFLFFCLGDLIFLLRSLFFLIICLHDDEKQMIFINSFKIIDVATHVLILTFLFLSCLFDYKKINKNFVFFKKKYLSMYIASGLIYLLAFCLDIFFTKILFHIVIKNNIFNDNNNYKIYAIINFVFVNAFCILSNFLQWLARKNILSEII